MGRLGVSVQAFKELEKKYIENEHVLYILNNWIRNVRIFDSNTTQQDEDAVVAEHFHYCRKLTEEVIWMQEPKHLCTKRVETVTTSSAPHLLAIRLQCYYTNNIAHSTASSHVAENTLYITV
jgi:hypothetical protein